MAAADIYSDRRVRISRSDMERLARLVYAKSGIALRPDLKEAMVVARLQKRVRTGGFGTFADYFRHVEQDRTGRELQALLDALTTNHTSFFREPEHFDFLSRHVLPPLVASRRLTPILGWTAACATGEEAYSLAITMLETVPAAHHSRVWVLASDLSHRALEAAGRGVYPIDRVSRIPTDRLQQYFERGLGANTGTARVHRALQRLVDFRRLNLMDIDDLGLRFPFIFCRNAMIYFDRAARQRVVTMLARHLMPRGYLFLSQCESLSELTHPFKWCAAGVYQRGDA